MSAERFTVQVNIKNDTDLGLAIFGRAKARAKEVPKEIEPHSTVSIKCTSHLPTALGFGHRGYVAYNGEDEMQRTCQFEFKWDYNALFHRAVAKYPEYYCVFSNTARKNHHLYVDYTIERCQYLEYPLEKRFQYLAEYTYFSPGEIPMMYDVFKIMSGGKERIDKDQFFQFFSMFDKDDTLIQSLFDVFSSIGLADNIIDFEEYCQALSIVCRGSFYEKTRLAYAICDLDKNGYVSEVEALAVAEKLSKLMSARGFDPATYGSPKEVIETIYRTAGERKIVEMPGVGYEEFYEKAALSEGLSKEEFINKALVEPDMSECFGLFKFWRERILNNYLRPQLAGLKYKEYSGHVYIGRKRRWIVLRDGFMACYKTSNGERPYKVFDMTLATLKESGNGVLIKTFHSALILKIKEKLEEWVEVLRSHIREGYRYQSFRETRLGVNAKYLVNGEEYFAALLKALQNAQESIYIAGWYLAPWIYLKRNPVDEESELGKVLYAKAKEGVKIRIIIWDCQKFVYDLQSSTVCKLLEHTHPNIECISHPHNLNLLWSHHQKSVVIDENIAFLGGIDLAYNRYDDSEYSLTDPDSQKFPGRDYSNFALHPEESGKPIPDVIDRSASPRMPWHDISLQITGLAAQDVAINFIQKWNHCLLTSSSLKKTYLIPSRKIKPVNLPKEDLGFSDCKVQILRSAGSWSLGIPITEKSISKAYETLITHSDHFVYIENQYFISGLNGDAKPQNRILRALYDRLRRAISHKEKFRVVLVLPVHPAGDPKALSTRFIMKFAAETINLGENSIFEKLAVEFPDVDLNQYISFHALRNHGNLDGRAVTEQIYIHAKLLIVDDRVVIIGSANINDRSMCGDRDSEICALVEPDEYVQSTMAGKPYPVSSFAHELRMKLWRSYLGLPQGDESVKDPVCDEVYQGVWKATAKNNTEIYKTVFPIIADNIESVEEYKGDPTPQNAEMLQNVKGFLVDYPYRFLFNSLIGVVPMPKIFI